MRKLLLLISVVLLNSCKEESKIIISENTKIFSQFPGNKNLVFENLVEFPHGNPREIIALDSILILGNFVGGQEYYLYNYSLDSNSFSDPYIEKGRGPGQIMGMASIGAYKNNLWINDFTGKKIMLIDKNQAIVKNSNLGIKEYSFGNNRFFDLKLIDDLKCLATGSETSKYKIQVIDLPSAGISEEFGKLNSYNEDLPWHVITKASLTQSFLKPSSDKLVLAYFHTDVVEIFDLNTKKSVSIQGPEKFDIDFTMQNNEWFENDNTKVAFIGGSTTDNYIYLLYSGKKFNEENAFRGRFVYVYDWNLNPIKKITLNQEVYQISVSKDGQRLYSYDETTGFIVNTQINQNP